MASQWFYQVMDGEVGPISSVRLRDLAERGAISADTQVRKALSGGWVPASTVKGLLATTANNTVLPLLPEAQPPTLRGKPVGVKPVAVVHGDLN